MIDAGFPRQGGHVEIVSVAAFEGLADEWDDLALRTDAPPFARPGWVRAWWSAFGRGELRILTSRRDGELSSVLPLARFRGALRTCSNVHSPVFDGVCLEPEDLQTLLTAALLEGGQSLVLSQLDSEGRLAAATRQVASQNRWRLVVLDATVSPYVDTTVSWEEFEQSLTKSRLQDVRRRRRRLAEKGEIAVEITDGTEDLEAHLSEFFRLEGSGWKEEKGTAIHLLPETRRFYEDVAAWAASRGQLRLSMMRLDGRPVAVEFTIDDGVRRYLLKIGYEPEYSRYGPGVLLQLGEIRCAFEDGRTYEFGVGMNAIKEELRNAQRTIEHVALFPRSARGTLACWAVETRQAVYRQARESMLLRRGRDTVRRRRTRRRASSPDPMPAPD